MHLAFELSGEHETLPKAEVLACLDTLNIPYNERMFLDRVLVVDAQLVPENQLLDILSRRLGMTHRIYDVKGVSAPDEMEIMNIVQNVDFDAIMGEKCTFSVRIRFAHTSSLYLRRKELLVAVGNHIRAHGYQVNLENPSKTFVILFTAHACLFCVLVHVVNRQQFKEKKPHVRPFFSPVVIMPKFARALVNLSGVKAGDLFLDPFCGTGGIVIEAATVGARAVGADVQRKMVNGARENMAFFGLPGAFIVSDASKLPMSDTSVDAIGTDLPYGRASFVFGSSTPLTESRSDVVERLYQDALTEIYRVLKPGRRAVIVSNSASFQVLARKHGFRLVEQHSYRIHKSLTRYITILEKA